VSFLRIAATAGVPAKHRGRRRPCFATDGPDSENARFSALNCLSVHQSRVAAPNFGQIAEAYSVAPALGMV
jgi:hypothetical protein